MVGVRAAPARPMMTNIAASPARPLSRVPQDRDPRITSAGISAVKASDTTRSAAAPGSASVIAIIATVMIVRAPANVTRPLATEDQLCPPIVVRALPISCRATATTMIAPAERSDDGGIRLRAAAITARAPAMDRIPFAIAVQDILPNLRNASPIRPSDFARI